MKSNWTFGLLVALVFSVGRAEARTWTDATSGKQIEAEYEGSSDGKVQLRRSDGKSFEVPLSRLSADDQAFVEEQMASDPAADSSSATPAAATATATGAGGGADWPTWRGTKRDGISPDTGLKTSWPSDGPALVWTYENAGKGYSAPAIVGGVYYITGSRDGKALIIALNADTGEELWVSEIGEDPEDGYNTGWGAGTRGAPTVSEGRVYAMTANGDLVCVSAEGGEHEWGVSLTEDFGGKVPNWGYSEAPLVDGDKVLVTPGGEDGAILALAKASGKEVWRSEDLGDGAAYSSIIAADVNGTRQYIQLFQNTLAGVDAESGKVLWTSEWPQGKVAVIPTPIYVDGHVYMTSGYGAGCKLVKIDGGEAEDVYENKDMENHHGGVVLVDGHVYGFTNGKKGNLVCQDVMTGEQKWMHREDRTLMKGAVHAADGMLYCLDENEGDVWLVEASPNGFEEKGHFKLPRQTELREGTKGKIWSHPVVINGKLYLRDNDLVFCYDVKG